MKARRDALKAQVTARIIHAKISKTGQAGVAAAPPAHVEPMPVPATLAEPVAPSTVDDSAGDSAADSAGGVAGGFSR